MKWIRDDYLWQADPDSKCWICDRAVIYGPTKSDWLSLDQIYESYGTLPVNMTMKEAYEFWQRRSIRRQESVDRGDQV